MSRTLNIALNTAKLSQKKIQLTQFENRIAVLKSELVDLEERRSKKAHEVSTLETAIQAAQTAQTVSS